jgi:hypothetical protein
MKAAKGIDFVLNTQGTLYQRYRQGWLKAVENFEKSKKDFSYEDKPFFRLHDN